MNRITSRTPMAALVAFAMLTTSSLAVAQSPRDADAPPPTPPTAVQRNPPKLTPNMQTVLDALGLTAVHVNRVLRRLRQHGVMDFRNSLLIISSVSKLAHVAGFDDQYLQRRLMAAA